MTTEIIVLAVFVGYILFMAISISLISNGAADNIWFKK